MSTATKSKIMKTNRICLKAKVIYCSSKITGDPELRELLVRLGQKLFPLKGQQYKVEDRLMVLMKKHPEHFPNSSLVLMGVI